MPRPRSDEKRARILKASIEVFAREGFFDARISDVAKKAGVADGTIYLYFKNKDHLLTSLFEELMAEHVERGREEIRNLPDAPSKLRAIARYHLELLGGDRDLAIVFQVELRQSTKFMERFTASWFGTYLDEITEIVATGQSEGSVRSDVSPKLLAKAFFGALDEMVTSWILAKRRDSLPKLAEPIVSIFLDGAAPRDHPAGRPATPLGVMETT